MAVTNGPIARNMYIGLSSDQKPIGQIEFAAFFYEYDTGRTFIWTGANVAAPAAAQWVEYLPLYPTVFLDNPLGTIS